MSKFIYWVNTDLPEETRPVMKSTPVGWRNIKDVKNVMQTDEKGQPLVVDLYEPPEAKKKPTRKRVAKVAASDNGQEQ